MPDFPTTRLSLVLAAADSRDALAAVCRMYWQPLYTYVRRWGYSHEEAQDLTQGFIARLLEKGVLRDFHQERGRFRSFLLASLRNFLNNQRDAALAQKRGGAARMTPVEDAPLRDDRTPETIFEKQWALGLLNRVLGNLRLEFEKEGKSERFGPLSAHLTGEDSGKRYRQLARDLGMSEGAVKVAVHRLRRRFHEALREDISLTVTDAADIGDEIRYLLSVLA